MIIQHNIAALNSHRNLGINNSFTSKNLEKLSSGFRINRAGDDAAGLAISEKMRGQIRGLAMAEQNTSNGVSLIQTAEGGLNETHAILQRMRELAVQSSNGTYDEDVDRVQLEKEFQAIKDEIDRIAESTHYNGIKLLDGSLGSSDKTPKLIGSKSDGQTVPSTATNAAAAKGKSVLTGGGTLAAGDTYTITYQNADGKNQTFSFTNNTASAYTDVLKEAAKVNADFAATFDVSTTGTAEAVTEGINKGLISSVTMTDTKGVTSAFSVANTAGKNKGENLDLDGLSSFTIDGKTFQIISDPSQLKAGNTALYAAAEGAADTTDMKSIVAQLKEMGYAAEYDADKKLIIRGGSSGSLTFQIGANGGADQRVSLSVAAMDSKSIGITDSNGTMASSLASASISTQDSANAAIDIITGATNMVSSTRADLGALQNRLEHTLNNLGVTKENLTAAESSIRDVDMAKEMMDFTKNQILVQASQSMLAQANQLPQGVMNLLR